MNPQIIKDTQQTWTQEPQKAQGTPTVKATTDGTQAVLEAGPFTWRTDLPAPLGGTNEAPSPTAMLLGSLAGCAAVFIQDTLAPQLEVNVSAVEATVKCQTDARGLLGMNGASPALQDVEIQIRIESSDSREKVEQLYQTWKERCPVFLALTKPVSVTTTLK